jgi:hypothetical protein
VRKQGWQSSQSEKGDRKLTQIEADTFEVEIEMPGGETQFFASMNKKNLVGIPGFDAALGEALSG